MRSLARLARTSALILTLTTVGVGGCAGTPHMPVTLLAPNCSELIPASYRKPVPGAPIPPVDASGGQVWAALDDQTGRLDTSNGRTADVIAICEAAAVRAAKVAQALAPRPWWKFWIP